MQKKIVIVTILVAAVITLLLILCVKIAVNRGFLDNMYLNKSGNFNGNYQKDNINNQNNNQNNINQNNFKSCSSGTWGCVRVTQGEYDPENPAPTVCGCAPTCNFPELLVASSTNEFWQDGSTKGTFECTINDVPVSDVP